jgi:hypothetical protein
MTTQQGDAQRGVGVVESVVPGFADVDGLHGPSVSENGGIEFHSQRPADQERVNQHLYSTTISL